MTVLDVAKNLISFDTSGPPAHELPLAKWIQDYLEDLKIDAEVQLVEPDRANVVAKVGAGSGKGIVLSGHIDVVPPGQIDLWIETAPFEPTIKNGRLYGRGACDMKGPDACILQAVKELRHEKFKRQLTLAFTAGEETGGWFVDKILEKLVTSKEARFGLIPEPSMMQIVRAHKGNGEANVIIYGKAAHIARPKQGANAIFYASDFVQRIMNFQKILNRTRHPLLGSSTLKPTIIRGGFKSNIIPDRCTMTLDLRLIPEHTKVDLVKGWISAIFGSLRSEMADFDAELVNLRVSEALDIPETSEIVVLLKEVRGTKPIGVSMGSEAVSYTQKGIPTVVCGPGDIDQAHTPNEFIRLEQLEAGTNFLKKIIRRVCL